MQMETRKKGNNIHIRKKIDFQTKTVTKGKEAHYIMIKAPIQEDGHSLTYAHPIQEQLHGQSKY